MTVHSRNKGNRGEREACVFLNGLFDVDDFKRVIGSGAHAKNDSRLAGDVFSEAFPDLCVEVKNHKGDVISDVMLSRGNVVSWVKQAKDAANVGGKNWLLVIKSERRGRVVIGESRLPMVVNGLTACGALFMGKDLLWFHVFVLRPQPHGVII